MIKPRISVARRSFFRAIRLRSFTASCLKEQNIYVNIVGTHWVHIYKTQEAKLIRIILTKLACAAVNLGCVGDRIFSAVEIGFASLATVVAIGVALTILAIADGWFAHPLLDDLRTLLRTLGPPLKLEITEFPFKAFGFSRPVSIRSLASVKQAYNIQ